MLIISLVFGVLQVAFAVWCFGLRAHAFSRVVGFLGGNVILVLLGGPAVALNAALLTISMTGTLIVRSSRLRFVAYAFGCTVVAYGSVAAVALREPLERMRQREAFPFESLSSRLAYETNRSSTARTEEPYAASEFLAADSTAQSFQADEPGHLDRLTDSATPTEQLRQASSRPSAALMELEDRLEAEEPRIPWRGNRARALEQIHESQLDYFINSPGFGVSRMMPRSPVQDADIAPATSIRLDRPDPIDLDATQPDELAGAARPDTENPPADPPPPNRLRRLHLDSTVDFVNAKGWGYVRDRNHVAGFQVHHFRRTPSLGDPATSANDDQSVGFSGRRAQEPEPASRADEEWAVRKVELVSLLKYDEPRVYVTADLPRMDRLSDVQVRSLTAFEQRALRELDAGEDIVNQPALNRVEMLGAIRAAQQCLKCHQVERGDLLGAFSYVLERIQPIREQPDRQRQVF
jgi:hypothetical protein